MTRRLFLHHQKKFNGNNSKLAQAAGCAESTIRNVFSKLNDSDKGQDITIGMAIRLCYALDITLSELAKDLYLGEKQKS